MPTQRPSIFEHALHIARRIGDAPEIDPNHIQCAPLRKAGNFHPRAIFGDVYRVESSKQAERMASALGHILRAAVEDQHVDGLKISTLSITHHNVIPTRYQIGVAIGNPDSKLSTPPVIPSQQIALGVEALRREIFGTKSGGMDSAYWHMSVIDLGDGKGMVPAYKWEAFSQREEYLLDIMRAFADTYQVPYRFTPAKGDHGPAIWIPKPELDKLAANEITPSVRR